MSPISKLAILTSSIIFFFSTFVEIQSMDNTTDFSCSRDSETCQTYVFYRAQSPEYLNVSAVADLFGVSPLSIKTASNLTSEDVGLVPGQLLLVPILCGCTNNFSFANITYEIKNGNSFYFVSTSFFERLTNFVAVEAFNPSMKPAELKVGAQAIFPLFCKCPTSSQIGQGIKQLITYVWQEEDNVTELSDRFNASESDVKVANNYWNFTLAIGFPILFPVKNLPILSQLVYPTFNKHKAGRHRIVLIVPVAVAAPVSIIVTLLCVLAAQDMLSPRVADCLNNLLVYDYKTILAATSNLSDKYRMGDSVYRVEINGKYFAVKRAKGDIAKELSILQRVNHANLITISGISSSMDGTYFLVYEFAENVSLDKWLPSSKVFLSWKQRLSIALDVALGLQYMHEHTIPRIVHKNIRTCSILLNSQFKAKISNFSMAIPATDPSALKADVYAFGLLLLELLSGRRAVDQANEANELVMLLQEVKLLLECQERKEERLKKWMDSSLDGMYSTEEALNMVAMASACTCENPSARPSMGEIVFAFTVLSQSTIQSPERSWADGIGEGVTRRVSPVQAR